MNYFKIRSINIIHPEIERLNNPVSPRCISVVITAQKRNKTDVEKQVPISKKTPFSSEIRGMHSFTRSLDSMNLTGRETVHMVTAM